MFSKFKLKKPPMSLGTVTNAMKKGGRSTLSPENLSAKDLEVKLHSLYGIEPDSIVAVAYDPVQSLIAVSTKNNEVRVLGQHFVEVLFVMKTSTPVKYIRFVKSVYLVCVQPAKGGVTVISLLSKQALDTYRPSSEITAVELDPSMDFLILGFANGTIVFYDVDRQTTTPFRIDNLQKKVLPKQKLSPVLEIEWHPRDISTILITYSHCAVTFSLNEEKIKKTFIYVVHRGDKAFDYTIEVANEGKRKIFGTTKEVTTAMTEAHFHPNGLHIVTVHKDNSLVFWDANDGTLIQARTIFDTDLNKPGSYIPPPTQFSPISCVKWVCSLNPEITQLIISGGLPDKPGTICVINFGYTLKYSLTSHDKQSAFYANPASGITFTDVTFNSRGADAMELISQIIPLLRPNLPYFGGNHNPAYLLLLSNYGALYALDYTVNQLPANELVLPPSLDEIVPAAVCSYVLCVNRVEWYNLLSNRISVNSGAREPPLIRGGSPRSHLSTPPPFGADDSYRIIRITGHHGGVVTFRDVTRGEHHDTIDYVKINLSKVLYLNGDPKLLKVTSVSLSFESKEVLVGLANGDVVILKYGKKPPSELTDYSKVDYNDCPIQHQNGDTKMYNISGRVLGPYSHSNFLPVGLVKVGSPSAISCLKVSNVGFGAVAHKSGRLNVYDISRGPAVIYNLGSIKEHLVSIQGDCYVTSMEFTIMQYGDDGYSSLVLTCGTNCGGNLLIFKIVPRMSGGFEVQFANKIINLNYRVLGGEESANSSILNLIPINSVNGQSAVARLDMFHRLSQGIVIPAIFVVVSDKDLRVIELPKNKLTHKVIDDRILASGVVSLKERGIVLATLVKLGFVKLSSLPSLSDIGDVKLSKDVFKEVQEHFQKASVSSSLVTPSGDIYIPTSSSQGLHLVVHSDSRYKKSKKGESFSDNLFNENAVVPPRPLPGTLQCAKGQTIYITSSELSSIIAGPTRKTSKHIESSIAHRLSPEANPNQSYGYDYKSSEKLYDEPVRRTKGRSQYNLGTRGFMRGLQDGIESVEESVNSYATELGETLNDEKNSVYQSALKSRLGI